MAPVWIVPPGKATGDRYGIRDAANTHFIRSMASLRDAAIFANAYNLGARCGSNKTLVRTMGESPERSWYVTEVGEEV